MKAYGAPAYVSGVLFAAGLQQKLEKSQVPQSGARQEILKGQHTIKMAKRADKPAVHFAES